MISIGSGLNQTEVWVIEATHGYYPSGGSADIQWVGVDPEEGKRFYLETYERFAEANEQKRTLKDFNRWVLRDEVWLTCLTDSSALPTDLRSWILSSEP